MNESQLSICFSWTNHSWVFFILEPITLKSLVFLNQSRLSILYFFIQSQLRIWYFLTNHSWVFVILEPITVEYLILLNQSQLSICYSWTNPNWVLNILEPITFEYLVFLANHSWVFGSCLQTNRVGRCLCSFLHHA